MFDFVVCLLVNLDLILVWILYIGWRNVDLGGLGFDSLYFEFIDFGLCLCTCIGLFGFVVLICAVM